jgi:predicted DNA-binding transcriptional regulator YafY
MNRLDRLSAILIQLQSKKVVRAQEIAGRFGISLRTVYRDIRSLEEGGIPIIGEAGVGYSIMDGYRLPPVMFTREEATALMVAEKVVEKYTDQANAATYSSALLKIRSVLRSAEKDFISSVEENIMVLRNSMLPSQENDKDSLQKILTAINEKKLLYITYEGLYSEGITKRSVEPVGIFLQNSAWYLIAWCRLRKDYRNFKVNRIKSQEIGDEKINAKHISLTDYLDRTSREQQLETVILRISRDAARYIVTEKYYHGFVSETPKGDWIEMTFLTASLQGMSRWFLVFGDHAEIVQPAGLKTLVLEQVSRIEKKLK